MSKKWVVGISLIAAVIGCQPTQKTVTSGERAQRLAAAASTGVWTSPRLDTANSWQVAFLATGTMTISGPGLQGHGTYRASADVIVAQLRGSNQTIRFLMDPTGRELVFDTGISGDQGVPVRLVRAE